MWDRVWTPLLISHMIWSTGWSFARTWWILWGAMGSWVDIEGELDETPWYWTWESLLLESCTIGCAWSLEIEVEGFTLIEIEGPSSSSSSSLGLTSPIYIFFIAFLKPSLLTSSRFSCLLWDPLVSSNSASYTSSTMPWVLL